MRRATLGRRSTESLTGSSFRPIVSHRRSRRARNVLIWTENVVRNFTAVIEKCPDTGLFVGYVPGFPGAHSQGETLDELNRNLRKVIEMLLEEGEPRLQAEFVGTQQVVVP